MVINHYDSSQAAALWRLDPRLKVGGLAWLTFWIGGAKEFELLLSLIGCTILTMLGRIPVRVFRSSLIAFFFLSLFYGVALGWVPTEGWKFWKGYWSLEGIFHALLISFRLGLVFWITVLFITVTSPVEQGMGIAYFLTPLMRLSSKGADLILLITLTLRFIPLLIEEGRMVWRARILKGPWPDSFFEKIVQGSKLVTAMILLSLRRAEEVGENLLVRGYASGSYKIIRYEDWKTLDSWALLILLLWPVLMRMGNLALTYTF